MFESAMLEDGPVSPSTQTGRLKLCWYLSASKHHNYVDEQFLKAALPYDAHLSLMECPTTGQMPESWMKGSSAFCVMRAVM